MSENPSLNKYEEIAREIASRTGNATLAKSVMGAYLDVAQTYNYFAGRLSDMEKSRVVVICPELDNLANGHNAREMDTTYKLERFVQRRSGVDTIGR